MPYRRLTRVAVCLGALALAAPAIAAPHVAAGQSHALLLMPDGTVRAWGANSSGQVGDNSFTTRKTPVTVLASVPAGSPPGTLPQPLGDVTAIGAGLYYSVALRSDGTVWAWGSNWYGLLGVSGSNRSLAAPVPGLSGVTAIAAGYQHVVALKSDGTAWVWGSNAQGQWGNGSITQPGSPLPAQVAALGSTVASIGAGNEATNSYAVKADGTLWAWGANNVGQIGDGTTGTPKTSPTQVAPAVVMSRAVGGPTASYFWTAAGQLRASGYNYMGQLADGSYAQRTTPVLSTGAPLVAALAAGTGHAVALVADGTVWTWGANSTGQLGYGTTGSGAVPGFNIAAAVSGLAGVSSVAAAGSYSLALATDGRVWAWGDNGSWNLGDGTNATSSVPVLIYETGFVLKTATPQLSLLTGTYGAAPVTITCASPSAVVHYTTNGAEPTESDPIAPEGFVFTVPETMTLRAKAWVPGMPPSHVRTAMYTMKVVNPGLSPSGGAYGYPAPVTITSTTPTAGAVYRYTLEGATPTASSPIYTSALTIATATTLKLQGFKTNWVSSDMVTASYAFNYGTLATPTADQAGGTYTGQVVVTLSGVGGVTIRYTTDGADPTTGSPAYTGPITLATTKTLKAKAFKVDYTASATFSSAYTIQAAPPSLSHASGTYAPGEAVTITSNDGSTLRLTLSGLDPTASDPVVVSGTSMMVGPFPLKVRAFRAGTLDSAVAAATYALEAPLGGGAAAAGTQHTVLATPDGLLYAWGGNGFGQLGDSSNTQRTAPRLVHTVTGVVAVAAGSYHTLALTWDGQVYAWGRNAAGEVGDGTLNPRNVPVLLAGLTSIVAIAAGDTHSAAVTATGQVYTWGYGASGQLGVGSTANLWSPTLVAGVSDVTAIAAGVSHTLVATAGGQLYAWGANSSHQLGDGTTTMRQTPILITGISGVVTVAAGASHSLARTQAGAVYAWGSSGSGQLGMGNTQTKTTPTLITGLSTNALASGQSHVLALRADGTFVGWGQNANGQVGDTTATMRTSAVTIVGPTGVALFAGGASHSVAILPSGHVWTWGVNSYGQLGDGTTISNMTPRDLMTLPGAWGGTPSPVLTLAPGLYHTPQTAGVTASSASTIHYRTDGATPTEADPVLSVGTTLPVNANLTLTVRAWVAGLPPSAVIVGAYELQPLPPTAAPAGGTYQTAPSVTLSAEIGTEIRYTLDSSDPGPTSPLYSSPVAVPASLTLKAKAFRAGWTPSVVTGHVYQIFVPITTLTLVPPSPGGTVNAHSATTISAAVTSNVPIAAINFYVEATLLQSVTAPPYHAAWTPTQPGSYTITANAVDTAGRVTNAAPISVTVHAVPVITSVSPTGGMVGAQIAIAGSSFGATQGASVIWLGNKAGAVTSWSDTEIVAVVATGAVSGIVQVRQGSISSNSVPFTVQTPTITSVTPDSGLSGTSVTIAGATFGATQGTGQVWLGTVPAVVTSWSNNQIVATVAAGSTSGNAQVLQDGVLSNAVPFTIGAVQPAITGVWPSSGAVGATFTIYGSGFGASQGSSTVTLAGTGATVDTWTDTMVAATVPSGAMTGSLKVQRNGTWSNGVTFHVTSTGSQITLTPNIMNLLVGETRSIQALDDVGTTLTNLAWSSSEPTVVSLSTDDPPVLTALAVGTTTITAGTASADITVHPGVALPIGTVIWSAPGNSSGVSSLRMAVPNYDAVADVFSEQHDGSVQAITADGWVAWTAPPPPQPEWGHYTFMPDFQGGLVAASPTSIYRLDPLTGAASPIIASVNEPTSWQGLAEPAIHPDGTLVTVDYTCQDYCDNPDPAGEGAWVVGKRLADGSEAFRVRLENTTDDVDASDPELCRAGGSESYLFHPWPWSSLRIAGDGFAYLGYVTYHSTTTIQRATEQAYGDAQYDLYEVLHHAIWQADFAAAIAALAGLAPSLGTPASSQTVEAFRDALVRGDRNTALGYLSNTLALMFWRPCDVSTQRTAKLHLLRVGMDGTSSDVVVKQWSDIETIAFTLLPGWSPTASPVWEAAAFRITDTRAGPVFLDVDMHVITNADDGAVYSWKAKTCALTRSGRRAFGRSFRPAPAAPSSIPRSRTISRPRVLGRSSPTSYGIPVGTGIKPSSLSFSSRTGPSRGSEKPV